MSRTKKSRTAGNSEPSFTGNRKETSSQAQSSRDRKRKEKLKGNKAGARNAVHSKQTQKQNAKQAQNEQRIGSQKPIPLIIAEKQPDPVIKPILKPQVKVIKNSQPVVLSAEKELASIENDQRLNELLEQLDSDQAISQIDQSWLDKQMQRHQQLMQQLGWLDDDGEEDLLQQFEDAGSALDEFKK